MRGDDDRCAQKADGISVVDGADHRGGGLCDGHVDQRLDLAPILKYPVWGANVTGFVEVREERARSDRIVVRVRKGTAPAVGAFVSFKARLTPPLGPLRPGGYDFARDMYFQEIGASGWVLGKIATVTPPVTADLRLRAAATVQSPRDAIDARIRAVLTGDTGSIASALITGKRDAISQP